MNVQVYKYWLIQYLDMVDDVKNTIRLSRAVYERIFKLPEPDQFINNQYINNQGIVFNKITFMNLRHHNQNKEAILSFENGSISHVTFLYESDPHHHYTIAYCSSGISKLKMIKQPYTFQPRNGRLYASTIDPTFIAL